MSRKFALPSLCLASALLGAGVSQAEDIDIFLPDPDIVAGLPNVLFVIDNGASWESNIGTGKASEMVHQALHAVATRPELIGKVNVGMMTFTKTSSTNQDGGKVVMHVDAFTEERQKQMSCRIYRTDTPTDTHPTGDGFCDADMYIEKNNNTPHAQMLNEAYLYFRGATPRAGLERATNVVPTDANALRGTLYNSPAHNPASQCADNFIIFIGTGTPDSADNTPSQALLTALGGVLPGDPIRLDPAANQFQPSWSDEFARYFANSADVNPNLEGKQSIRTFTIDVFNPESNQAHTYGFLSAREYFKSIGKQGGGGYFKATNTQELVDAVLDIMAQIQAVNTVFASVSLPISVNVQGTHLNQVYVGMFRPDGGKLPRWVGNIKRYQYLFDGGNPYLAGADGRAAYNSTTGFINPDAVSYWTTASNFWAFHPQYSASDRPDGDIVEKGAAAQRLRERTADRAVFTCTGDCTGLDRFDTTNSAVSAVLTDDVINWTLGANNRSADAAKEGSAERRASIHGDVLHARPAVVNYSRTGADGDDVVLFYGSNDGIFRAVAGSTGEELWGFVAEEHFADLQTLYTNQKAAEGEPWRPYFMDGNPTVIHTPDVSALYLTMRRGGRSIYALDVSTPESPRVMWRKSYTDTGYSELGQTWSTPVAAYVRAMGTSTPVLIFGLGYDPVEDYMPVSGTRTMGRGILVVNALTGEPIWQAGPSPSGAQHNKAVAGMDYAIPADVRVINRSGSSANYADTLYVGDTGGNLWRADLSSADPSEWTIGKLGSVGGCDAGGNCRKFLYPPSIVFGDAFDAVLIGTGDREQPADKTVTNRFYMFKDTRDGVAAETIVEAEMLDVTATPTNVDTQALAESRGWYITLEPGEKLVGQAVTLASTTIFNTNLPVAPERDADGNLLTCASNLGEARQYYVHYLDGTNKSTATDTRYVELPGGGYAPPPVPMTLIDPDGKPWTGIGGLNPYTPGDDIFGKRVRTFWQKRTD